MNPLVSRLLNEIGLGSTIDVQKAAGPWTTSNGSLNNPFEPTILNVAGKPANYIAGGTYAIELRPRTRVALQFLASHATDPYNQTATARFWLANERRVPDTATFPAKDTGGLQSEIGSIYQGDLSLHVGNTQLATSSLFVHTIGGTAQVCKYVDTITISPDLTVGGVTVTGNSTDAWAEMLMDHISRRFLILQLKIGATLAGMLPLYREY